MRPRTSLIWLVGIAFLVCGESGQSQETPPEKNQLDYAVADTEFKSQDGIEMFGRLILPKSAAPRAVVIYVQTAEGATVDMKRSLGGGPVMSDTGRR